MQKFYFQTKFRDLRKKKTIKNDETNISHSKFWGFTFLRLEFSPKSCFHQDYKLKGVGRVVFDNNTLKWSQDSFHSLIHMSITHWDKCIMDQL